MDKQEIYKIVHPYCGNEHAEKVAQEIFDATYPVGGHHDHMCPCGRDWETERQITLKIVSEFCKATKPYNNVFSIGQLRNWLWRKK